MVYEYEAAFHQKNYNVRKTSAPNTDSDLLDVAEKRFTTVT